MHAKVFVFGVVAISTLLGSQDAPADDSVKGVVNRVYALLDQDYPDAYLSALKELSLLDEPGKLRVCSTLQSHVSESLSIALSPTSTIDLPTLSWPALQSESGKVTDVSDAKAAAARYAKAAGSQDIMAPALLRKTLLLIEACADHDQSRNAFPREWAEIKDVGKKLSRDFEAMEKSYLLRTEAIPMIAAANIDLLQVANLPESPSADTSAGDRTRLIASAKVAVARCLPHMKSAPDHIQAEYTRAVESIAASEGHARSKAVDLLILLSSDFSPVLAETSVEKEDAQAASAAASLSDSDNKRLLMLNRLTRDPTNIQLLRELSDSVLDRHVSPNQDALEAVRTVLSNAVYRIDEFYMPEVLARLEQLEDASRSIQQNEGDSSVEVASAEDIDAVMDQSSAALLSLQDDLAAFIVGRGVLRDGIERLSEILDDPVATAEQRSRANSLLTSYVEAEQARNTLHYLAASTDRLEDLKSASWPVSNLDEAISILNASEQLLSSLWGLSKGATSGSVKVRSEELPRLLAEYRDQILYAKSKDGLAAIADKAEQSESIRAGLINGGGINEPLKKIESLVRAAEGDFLRMPSLRAQTESQPLLQKMQSSVAELRREQINRYQHHVIAKCKEVFTRFDDQWYCTEGEAIRYFRRNNLAEVDQSLLTPEVSRCFNDCIGKLFGKMKPHNLVECEEAMGRPEGKLRLESF